MIWGKRLMYKTKTSHLIVNEHQNVDLMKRITDKEVKQAIFSINASKAPSEDGFPTLFYQQN